jgi:transcriptional regulator
MVAGRTLRRRPRLVPSDTNSWGLSLTHPDRMLQPLTNGNPTRKGAVHGACEVTESPRSPFEQYTSRDVIDLINEYPLAWVCPTHADGTLATLLPLLPETDSDGRLISLLGHMARRNPLHAALASDSRALVLFTGPQAYVSPARVSEPDWGPTWNYAQARITTTVRFLPDAGGEALHTLLAAMEAIEPTGWTTDKLGARYAPMERAIIAFRAEVVRCEARFKLGQDERPERLQEILTRHPDRALVRWMRRFNKERIAG